MLQKEVDWCLCGGEDGRIQGCGGGNLKKRNNLEDVSVGRRIILKYM
jgi:hypothetical protein